ncbi:MAG: WG repeat-containing protein [Lewinellaceae bacterium]|nr:WG repeat-containing protein [Lewinellaceae bacterium]
MKIIPILLVFSFLTPQLPGQNNDLSVLESYIPYRVKDKWGYCDVYKTMRIPVQYEAADFFRDGYAVVKQDGLYHLIDTTGARITELGYASIQYSPSLGYELLAADSSSFTYAMLAEGRLQPRYPMVKEVPDELIIEEPTQPGGVVVRNGIFKEDGKYGFRSGRAIPDPKTGELQNDWDFLIPPKYDSMVVLGPNQLLVLEAGRWGMVGPDDQVLLEKEYEYISWVAFWGSRAYLVKRRGKWGIINRSFQPMMPVQYDTLILEGQLIIAAADGKWGTFNTYGQPIIPMKYDALSSTIFQRAKYFIVEKEGRWGVVDEKNKPYLPFQYLGIKNISGNYFIVKDSLGWGLADGKNQVVLPCRYDDIVPAAIASAPQFSGFLLIMDGKMGFFCPEADKLIAPKFLAFSGFGLNNLARVETESGAGYISWDGVAYFED